MAASNTRFTQNSLGQSKTPIDSDHGIYRDLRNVVAKHSFERSERFPVIQPNSGHRDYLRSSCDGGRRSSGVGQDLGRDACAGDTSRARADCQDPSRIARDAHDRLEAVRAGGLTIGRSARRRSRR
jgi:hypothetical protein